MSIISSIKGFFKARDETKAEPKAKDSRYSRSVYIQIAAVVTTFTLLVVLSSSLMGNIVKNNMRDSIEAAFYDTTQNINTDLLELETLLLYISETVRLMILKGFDFDTVTNYITEITEYSMFDDERLQVYATGIYAVFDKFDGRFFDGTGWQPPDDFVPKDRPWYTAALEADGKIGITEPYVSVAWGQFTMTFSRRIFDNDRNPIGIVCLDILLDRVRNYAVNTYFAKGGYGLLLNKNLEILAHPDSDLWGKPLRDIQNFSSIVDDLKNGEQVTERRIRNYKNEKSVISFRQLPNGWHIGIVIQEKIYFRNLTIMRLTLIFTGMALAAVFIAIILRLNAVKKELAVAKEENGLTNREQEILTMLLSGKEPKEIASSLNISYSGVNYHIKNIFVKFGIQSRAELMVKYLNK
jgi:DNA-binding CsgD family transcriptional regulator